ncbi:MAG: SUF system NifU family Fe-S cluster assembly protein [Rhodospirillales bacterium]|nr:SUF system NifU family Fe-S cluster assembly protein [Alphaproteobacteria bacterium]MCY4429098.1 SUF system NifU family Fe-S cluster assembly protein [Rhodospirillales bacterium]
MNDLRDLYQEVILDHSRNPRNAGRLAEPSGTAKGHNPLCGDLITLDVLVEDGTIRDVSFDAKGCAISVAAASIMSDMLKGKSLAETHDLFRRFQDMLTGPDAVAENLDKLEVLAGVREFPMRVKCATLPFHTLRAALDNQSGTVQTE